MPRNKAPVAHRQLDRTDARPLTARRSARAALPALAILPHAARAPTPRYYRLQVAIQKWIRDGVYLPGDRIPSEAQLGRDFRVSRITVRHALAELQRGGWLTREQGRGTFVAHGVQPPPVPVNWSDVLSTVQEFSRSTGTVAAKIRLILPDAATRTALRLPDGARVQRITHVRLQEGEPLGFVTNWVPEDLAARISGQSFLRTPTLTLLEQAGAHIGDSEQSIGADVATPRLASLLAIPRGAPLVRLERIVYDDDGRGVERVLALYRADRYRYRMVLTRSEEA